MQKGANCIAIILLRFCDSPRHWGRLGFHACFLELVDEEKTLYPLCKSAEERKPICILESRD